MSNFTAQLIEKSFQSCSTLGHFLCLSSPGILFQTYRTRDEILKWNTVTQLLMTQIFRVLAPVICISTDMYPTHPRLAILSFLYEISYFSKWMNPEWGHCCIYHSAIFLSILLLEWWKAREASNKISPPYYLCHSVIYTSECGSSSRHLLLYCWFTDTSRQDLITNAPVQMSKHHLGKLIRKLDNMFTSHTVSLIICILLHSGEYILISVCSRSIGWVVS